MGYLGNGLTITGTQNSKRIVVDATPNQTISTVTGGYLIGQLDVYRNGVKLVDTQDYTASDGSSVTFLSAASQGDELEFVVFENFDVANALSSSGGTVSGDLVVTGIATFNSDVSIGGTLTYEDVTNIDSVGIITARSFVSIADSIVHTGDENTSIRFPAVDTFTVETAGSERLRIDSEGKTTIQGTGSSNNPFEIFTLKNTETSSSAQSIQVNLETNRNSQQGVSKIKSIANDNSGTAILELNSSQYRIKDQASSSTYATIDSSGDVGIGEDSPDCRFHVKDTINTAYTVTNAVNSANNLVKVENASTTANAFAGMQFRTGNGADMYFGAIQQTSNDGDFYFANQNSTDVELMRIKSTGDVGIGTDSIAFSNGSGLEIVRSGTACVRIEGNGGNHALEAYADSNGATLDARGSSANLMFDTGGTERLRITGIGSVGIGTDDPVRKLHLHEDSSSNCLIQFTNTTTGHTSGDGSVIGLDGDESLLISNKESGGMFFHTSNTNRAYFSSGGTFALIGGGSVANPAVSLNGSAGSDSMVLDASSRLIVGRNAARTNWNDSSVEPKLIIEGAGDDDQFSLCIVSNSGTSNSATRGSNLILARTRGTSNGSNTTLTNNNLIGKVEFKGNDGTSFTTAAQISAHTDGAPGTDDMPGRIVLSTTADGAAVPTERLRIDSRGSFQFSNGFMNETVNINSTARNGTQAVNLDDGMVHYFTTSSSGTWKPNFTMSAGDDINATIATGDTFSVTMIVNKGNTAHFANSAQVDGSDITVEFSGGAPTDGGGNNTFDVYHYTIIKTGDDTFIAFASVSTYE